MKVFKIILAALLVILALVITASALTTRDILPALLERMDPENLAAHDAAMQKAKDRVTTALSENNPERAQRSLDRYINGFSAQLTLSGRVGYDLFFFRNGPSMLALALFLAVAAAGLIAHALDRSSKVRKLVLPAILITVLYVGVYIMENIAGANSMLMTVLKKGAIYALIAVSMNLLNGFTGLFSLGQAGFMLIGAYTYAIFSIETQSRAQVYQYYAGGIIQFQLPALLSIALAGLAAALFAFLIGWPVLRLKSDYLAIATLGFAEIIRAIFQYDGLGVGTLAFNNMGGLARGGTGTLKVDGKAVQTITMKRTLPMILQWDESFDIGSDTLTGVNDADYKPPFPFTGKLNKLTIKVDRPELSPDDIKKLQAAQRNNKVSE